MNEQKFILNLAKKEIEKSLTRLEKAIETDSGKLFLMNDENSTVRSRANKRAALSIKCEERDRWRNRLDIVNQWLSVDVNKMLEKVGVGNE